MTTTNQQPRIRDQKTNRLRKANHLDETRLRFNWGFHDGAQAQRENWTRPDGLTVETIRAGHFDPAYAEGYYLGWHEARSGADTSSSEPAWQTVRHLPILTPTYAPFRPAKAGR